MAERKRNRSNFGVRGLGAEESTKSQSATPKPSQSPRPSPDRLREKREDRMGMYDEMTYGQADFPSSKVFPTPEHRGGSGYRGVGTFSQAQVEAGHPGMDTTPRNTNIPQWDWNANEGRGKWADERPRIAPSRDTAAFVLRPEKVRDARRADTTAEADYAAQRQPLDVARDSYDQAEAAKRTSKREAIRNRRTYEPADAGLVQTLDDRDYTAYHQANVQAKTERTYGAADWGMDSDAVISWDQARWDAQDADRWATENNALGRADASTADAHVTPPSVPIEQKKSRGRIRRNDRNIQAFY